MGAWGYGLFGNEAGGDLGVVWAKYVGGPGRFRPEMAEVANASGIDEIELSQQKLVNAVMGERSDRYCRRLWSEFIRTRDGNRCVVCHGTKQLAAHHIVRKSFFPQARLQRGNGITLCADCHKRPHEGFNGKPNTQQPMDAEGGDNNDLITEYFGLLLNDATERGMLRDDFYFIHARVLQSFKELQGLKPHLKFPGTPLEEAYLIWRQTPPGLLNALLEANGLSRGPDDYIQLPGIRITSTC